MGMIRTARSYDAVAIARLCGELGYPATRQQVLVRLAAIEAAEAVVWVAEDDAGDVVGWIHVGCCAQLLGDARAEIFGLVVAARARGSGVGHELVERAGQWARERGCDSVCVRSRVERERARHFYLREGFASDKTQHVLARALG
ncbi:MAG: GNAT family N-acetyltransferase [Dokdonella sp.]|uniref:GNAT family N-acetyltransferase n=1 Tax=Dokdonella sp. TaxID=2291710 RepID=UPI0025BF95DB|nr:GNAT family N-acetyltransferase [Dokdonella sp.]MBX3699462.1 GNAT family N-acetyltransferase [Dokdonella sp.]